MRFSVACNILPLQRILRLLALLPLLTLHLPAAEAPAHPDAPLTSPSGKLHFRLDDSASLPGAITPVQAGEGDDEEYPAQTLALEEKGKPPFVITAPTGRCTPCWSDDEMYLALAIHGSGCSMAYPFNSQ